MAANSVAVVLCGGDGKRLWPLSTPAKPKPFHALTSGETLFQQALRRASAAPFNQMPIVVAQARHANVVRQQASEIGLEVDLVLEERANNTAVAVLLGALAASERHTNVTLAILASDHHIPDTAGFADLMQRAVGQCGDNTLMVFGVPPRSASSAYGYIVPQTGCDGLTSMRVKHFVEKPEKEQATKLLAEGALWNSGNFVMAAAALLQAARLHAPSLLHAAASAFNTAQRQDASMVVSVNLDVGDALSFDHAIVEKLEDVRVVPMAISWSDIGTWDEVHRISAVDGLLVVGDHIPVRVIGLEEVIVVATPDGILVTRTGHADALKAALT